MRALLHQFALLLVVLSFPRAASGAPQAFALPDMEEPDVSAGLEKPREPVDLSTPRRAWAMLLDACRKSRWDRAQHVLNLHDVPVADRAALGPALASQLCEVLQTIKRSSPESLADTPLGPLSGDVPRNYVLVASIPGPAGVEELWLRRHRDAASGQYLWLLTRKAVTQIPHLYRHRVEKAVFQRPFADAVNSLGPLAVDAENPRAALQAFKQLTLAGKFLEAARLLDLSFVSAAEQPLAGPRLARRLAIVLRQLHPRGYGELSKDALGTPQRDVPFDEQQVAQATLDGRSIPLRIARYPRRAGNPIWLFSVQTVTDIDPLYARLGYGWPGDHLPPLFFEWQLLGVQLWQWLGLGLALCAAILLGYIGARLLGRLLRRLVSLTNWTWDDLVVSKVRGPLWISFTVLLVVVQLPFLSLARGPHDLLLGASRLLAILALGWFLIRIVDAVGDHLFNFFKGRGDDMGMAMVPVARKIFKPIIFAIIAIVALQNIGMNVGGLLAGLGIGGLAMALAAKNTMENLFGSLVISFDRPFRLGDFVKVGDISGTVEDLGLRSTRLRTADRTLVTIPNAQLADAKVENFSRRDRMKFQVTLGLQSDTELDQLRFIVDELNRYLLAHPQVWQGSFSVRFVGLGPAALELEVLCWIDTADWAVFTGIREAMLMEYTAIVERAGAVLTFPVQPPQRRKSDPERARQASATVSARRAAGELTLPEIPESVRKALRPELPVA